MDLDFTEVHNLFYIIASSAENYSNNFRHWSKTNENTNHASYKLNFLKSFLSPI